MARSYIVDTGVFLRWFLPQVGYEHAREIRKSYLAGRIALETDEFAQVELAEVLRKRVFLPGHLTRMQYLQTVQTLDGLDVVTHRTTPDRLLHAASLATDYNLRMFDALFVQLSLARAMPLLTSDKRLRNAVGKLIDVELLRGIESPPVN